MLLASDSEALKGALLCGEGVMLAADVMVKPYAEQGHLQRVLPDWTGPEYDFNAVFPRGQVQSPKVRAFVDFLMDRLNMEADYMKELCPNRKREAESLDASATIATKLARVAAEIERPASSHLLECTEQS